jgi:dolichol-phosphate mannosyltransferase
VGGVAHPLRIAVAAVVVARAARTLGPAARLTAPEGPGAADRPRVTVLVPARNEARRLGPCLDALVDDPWTDELLVIDDRSTDDTAAVARAHGATVIAGQEPPPGRIGKPWALEQGLRAAAGEVVVAVDADVRPRPGLVAALVGELRRREAEGRRPVLVSAAPRVDPPHGVDRAVHAGFAATVPLRFGPTDVRGPEPQPSRATANGRLLCARARPLREAGGFALGAGGLTDDVALARALAGRGWLVAGADATALADVRPSPGRASSWRVQRRAITGVDVTGRGWMAADLTVLWIAQALPWLRLAAGRADAVDAALLAARAVVLRRTVRGLAPRRAPDPAWLAPLLDVPVVAAFTRAVFVPDRSWRGREY